VFRRKAKEFKFLCSSPSKMMISLAGKRRGLIVAKAMIFGKGRMTNPSAHRVASPTQIVSPTEEPWAYLYLRDAPPLSQSKEIPVRR
jgi:hypothetical protein